MTKHTPSPWGIVNRKFSCVIFSGETGATIANVSYPMDDDSQANARLMAAAPDLLEALKYMLEVCPAINNQGEEAYCKAHAAIAKATGEQE